MRDNFLVFGSPQIEEEEVKDVERVLRSRWLGTGPKVAEFEAAFAAYKGVPRAVAVNSCTAALHLGLVALDLKPGDEVITTALTFCATVNAIIHAGGTPVLADVDPSTMNIDPKSIEARLSPRTRAILPVHFAGRCCDMDQVMGIAKRHNLKVIEDCAHAIESEYHGIKAGTFGDYGCFSFYVTKNLSTGEGGMIIAKDPGALTRIKVLSLHGMSADAWQRYGDKGYKHYQVVEAGFKYNMMDIQAAIGLPQLRRLEANWRRRQEIWQRYMVELRDTPLTLPAPPEGNSRHAYHLFNVLVDEKRARIDRNEFLERLKSHKIGAGVHYQSVGEHPYYRERYGWKPESEPNAQRIGDTTLSLPLSAALSDEDVSDVIAAVLDITPKRLG